METTALPNYIAKEDDHSMKFQIHYFNSVTLYVLKAWNIYTETLTHTTFLILKEKSHNVYKSKFQAIFRVDCNVQKTPEISYVLNNTIPLPQKCECNFAIHKTHHSFPDHAEFYKMLLQAEQFLEMPKFV